MNTKDFLHSFKKRVFKITGELPLRLSVQIKKGILARFTNNGVHQNGFQDLITYIIRFTTKKGVLHVESNDVSREGIQDALARAKEKMFHPEPFKTSPKRLYPKVKEYFPQTPSRFYERAALAVEKGLRLIRAERAVANGYYSEYARLFYFADSSGREVIHPATATRFGLTITKGEGKGYFSFFHPNPKKLQVSAVVTEAIRLAREASRDQISVKPGEYECIFSPRAFLELIEPMRKHFDGYFAETRKSVFSGLLGKKLFSESLTLTDDVKCPGQFGVPFDAEGVPKKKVNLIERGILRGFLTQGHSTRGILEHPVYPQNLVIKNGSLSFEQMVKEIRRGIFINKIWYHTLVRERNLEVTGLATAGSLYIENGEVMGRAVNLRYHDSIFSILNSVIHFSKEQMLLKDSEMGAALFPYLWVSRLKVT